LFTGFNTPFDLLTGYGAGRSRITHLASKITVIAKVHMYVNGVGAGDSRQIKMFASWALFKTVCKRLPEDHTLLIALDATAVATHAFFLIASRASTDRTIA
jgi:hypothetical protein